MGLRPVAEIAPAAFLGSWAQVLPDVQRLVGGAPILGPDAPASGTAASVLAAEEAWRGLADRPDGVPDRPEAQVLETLVENRPVGPESDSRNSSQGKSKSRVCGKSFDSD